MIIDTNELKGSSLDWAVARSEGLDFMLHKGHPAFESVFDPEGPANEYCLTEFKMWEFFQPSKDWRQGGVILEKFNIEVTRASEIGYEVNWMASIVTTRQREFTCFGDTLP